LGSVLTRRKQFGCEAGPQLISVQLDEVLADLAPECLAQFGSSHHPNFADRPLWGHNRQPDKLTGVMGGLQVRNNLPDKIMLFQLVRIVFGIERILLMVTATSAVAARLITADVARVRVQV
jgi:hypothetical protein